MLWVNQLWVPMSSFQQINKLSFDILRRELKGLNAWVLVLDTKSINVWCAAGKGTFSTNELISRMSATKFIWWSLTGGSLCPSSVLSA